MGFQSPSGVLGVCRGRGLEELIPSVWFQSPSGVLGVCRIHETATTLEAFALFQSPSGVLGVCRLRPRSRLRSRSRLFQSPSGVLGVCRAYRGRDVMQIFKTAFQSPSGVLGVCRLVGLRLVLWAGHVVSVPFRGFRGLQGGFCL